MDDHVAMPEVVDGERYAVDAVIAVHDASRPVHRAVNSLVAGGLPVGGRGGLRITVVCHNVTISEIARRLPDELRSVVRWRHLADGLRSPAGPFNDGVAHSDAHYVMLLGSDDYVEPGAVADWYAVARRHRSAVVIAPQRHQSGAPVLTPPVRPLVGGARDPLKDRLIYRTAPLGLIGSTEIRRLGLRFTDGLPTGEDQAFSAALWFGGGRVDFPLNAGRYVVGGDAHQRVTYTRRDVRDEFVFLTALVESVWFAALNSAARRAVVRKLLRVHVFGLVLVRESVGGWTLRDRQALATTAQDLLERAPGAEQSLSRADVRLLDLILDPEGPTDVLLTAAAVRRRFGRPATLLTPSARHVLGADAPLRFTVAWRRCAATVHRGFHRPVYPRAPPAPTLICPLQSSGPELRISRR